MTSTERTPGSASSTAGTDATTTAGSTASAEDLTAVIQQWSEASNAHDRSRYLAFFTEDAVLDDPSVPISREC
ncbi:Cif family virulence factor [Desertihabitans aurantiacus]|uniref:hypothetical protein n=1 Tax=Desertihabitans aurantiacus TaxID=2282477 RepID=UPI000DF82542|nr:hypothetical protein [Desertihabitans aurantiacus]